MIIIGVDFHLEFQQIASVNTDTGELQEKRLGHREDAEKFYRDLAAVGQKVRVGMEASGHARWCERLLAELQFELWIGDAAEIRTKRVVALRAGGSGVGISCSLGMPKTVRTNARAPLSCGSFVVEVGELEGFVRGVGGH